MADLKKISELITQFSKELEGTRDVALQTYRDLLYVTKTSANQYGFDALQRRSEEMDKLGVEHPPPKIS